MKYPMLVMLLMLIAVPITAQEIISMPDPTLEDDMLNRMADLRARYNLPAYTYDDALSEAAQDQADWLVETGYRGHIRPDGNAPSDRAQAFGYQPVGWCCGENYYMSIDATPDMVWNFWTWSPSHRVNLLHPTFQEVGIGMATNGTRHSYVLVFGNSTETAASVMPETVDTTPEPSAMAAPVIANSGDCDTTHVIQQGENLFRIGLNYGFSAGELAAHNNITDVTRIYAGQRLCIPLGGAAPVESASTDPEITQDDNWCYTGNQWGDGRCNHPDNPALERQMWRCGWMRAQGMAGCGG